MVRFLPLFVFISILTLLLTACNQTTPEDYFSVSIESLPSGSDTLDLRLLVCPTQTIRIPFEQFDDWDLQVQYQWNPEWNSKRDDFNLDAEYLYTQPEYQISENETWLSLQPVWDDSYSDGEGCQIASFPQYFRGTSTWQQVQIAPFKEVQFRVSRQVSQADLDPRGDADTFILLEGKSTWNWDFEANKESSSSDNLSLDSSETDLDIAPQKFPQEETAVIPDDFFLEIREYFENWEYGSLDSKCIIHTDYQAIERIDKNTLKIESTSFVEDGSIGDCSWTLYDPETILINIINGKTIQGGENRFFGTDAQPPNAFENALEGNRTWVFTDSEDIPVDDYLYTYVHDIAIDQFSGLRLFRERNATRMHAGILESDYCQWGQTLSTRTNALVGGNPAGVNLEFALQSSGCSHLQTNQDSSDIPPSQTPCEAVYALYDIMNNENIKGFFDLHNTDGWSDVLYKKHYDYQLWYFNEHDWEFTVNDCRVDWFSAIPPYSAKVTVNFRACTVYKGTINDSIKNEPVYLTYSGNSWKVGYNWSLEDVQPLELTFINRSEKPVEVFWTDYDKDERLWFEMAPGEIRKNISSAATHFWSFYDKETGNPLLYYWVPETPQDVIIRTP